MANDFGYVRVAAAVPVVHLANPDANVTEMVALARQAAERGVQVLVFPELGITGYTCMDLFDQESIKRAALAALDWFLVETRLLPLVSVVGMPFIVGGVNRYNVAVICNRGRIVGVVPKSYIPTYGEFQESRWFKPAAFLNEREVTLCGQRVPIGADLIVDLEGTPGGRLGVEICEDTWMTIPPSGHLAIGGANILANLSASNCVLTKPDYRRKLIEIRAATSEAAYVYASCGWGESSADVVFDGHAMISDRGTLLAESERFARKSQLVVADVDIEYCAHERVRGSFGQQTLYEGRPVRTLTASVASLDVTVQFERTVDPHPVVPSDPTVRRERCEAIFAQQEFGLVRRLTYVAVQTGREFVPVAIGLSGGRDSTLAFLALVRAFDSLGWDRRGIRAYTMPGFGTTERTLGHAHRLSAAFGVPLREVAIVEASLLALRQTGHLGPNEHPHRKCLTCQNVQARERTRILMTDGFTIGTGDLSEAYLGWCTYNGDHMAMYNVNIGVPKSLVTYVIMTVADLNIFGDEVSACLRDICADAISPELDPLNADGTMGHTTEDEVGPYELHDFFIPGVLKYGSTPRRVVFLAEQAFANVLGTDGRPKYDSQTIRRWFAHNIRRFLRSQFKRNAGPDGLKTGALAVGQRGDLRIPSDAEIALWTVEADALVREAAA